MAGVTSPWHGAGLEEEKSHREVRARAQSHTARQRQGLPDAAGATPQWALVRESVLLGQLIVVGPTARRRRLSSEPLSSGVLAGSPAGSGWMIVVFFFSPGNDILGLVLWHVVVQCGEGGWSPVTLI